MKTRDVDTIADCLYRVQDFHRWVDTNILFPLVPDGIVHPLIEQLRKAEHLLIAALYDLRAIDKAVVIDTILKPPPR